MMSKNADRNGLPADRTLPAEAAGSLEELEAGLVCKNTELARKRLLWQIQYVLRATATLYYKTASCGGSDKGHGFKAKRQLADVDVAAQRILLPALTASRRRCAAPSCEADCCGCNKLKLCFRPTGVIPERSQPSALAKARSCLVSVGPQL
jgi:hypothetical protein